MSMLTTIPILSSVESLARRYDVWLCDIWGVIHNGVAAFRPAVEACQKFRAAGGKIAFITNAPRPADFVAAQLRDLGVEGAYDTIATSGDVTMTALRDREGQRIYHLGPERDKPMLASFRFNHTKAEAADFILNTGPFDDETETPEHYRARLEEWAARRIPMFCANPDMKVERGGKVIYCAGAIAALYQQIGGEVAYAGKPYAPIYDLAFAALGMPPDKRKVLAIGDGVHTDIAGAAAIGVDALFIASGVHVTGSSDGLTGEALAELFAGTPFRPVAAQARLTW